MLLFRPSLSLFRVVYTFVAQAGDRTFPLWAAVRRELQAALALLPLLSSDLKTSFFPRLIAFDASSYAQGVSVTAVSQRSAADLASAGAQQRNAFRHEQVLPREAFEHAAFPPVVASTVTSHQWFDLVSSPFAVPEHVNVLEARALSTSVRWAVSQPAAFSKHIVALTDSRVVYWAVNKGRSSSRFLYPRVKAIAAWLLATGCRLHLVWVPSELNPADFPSRHGVPSGR